jgi:hypothetical protein
MLTRRGLDWTARYAPIGYFDNGQFMFAGKVGTGFSAETGRDLVQRQ